MGRKFKRPLTGDINARHIGPIYGTGNRYDGLVPQQYLWFTTHDLITNYRYVWCHRKLEDGTTRPFSFKKVKQIPGKRGCSLNTIKKMIDIISQHVLEFEADDEIHYSKLGEARSPKHKGPKFVRE